MLGHVTRQVGLLRVRLPAHVADVRLQVLGLRVLWNVFPQTLLVGVALVAGVAAVRLVGHVAAGVGLEIRQLREGFAAAWMLALVRLLSSMRADVLLKMAQLGEAALADLAFVRLDAGVNASVLGQVGRVGKALVALRTAVRLRVGLMHLLTMY